MSKAQIALLSRLFSLSMTSSTSEDPPFLELSPCNVRHLRPQYRTGSICTPQDLQERLQVDLQPDLVIGIGFDPVVVEKNGLGYQVGFNALLYHFNLS